MNSKVSKMLHRIQKDTKEDKKEWYSFNWLERSEIIADYNERSKEVKEKYTAAIKEKKMTGITQHEAERINRLKEKDKKA